MKKNFNRIFILILTALLIIGTANLANAAAPAVTGTQGNPEGLDPVEETTTELVTSRSQFVSVLRTNLAARNTKIAIGYDLPEGTYDLKYFQGILDEAKEEYTGNPVEGDYLRLLFKSARFTYFGLRKAVFKLESVEYLTTASQESAVTSKVLQTLASLNLDGKDQASKIKSIHDYICNNAQFELSDGSGLGSTAYGNLIGKVSDSRGYALAFYRMALQTGIETRIIEGKHQGQDTVWNVVKLNGKYYLVDPALDDLEGSHKYFLKGSITAQKEGFVPKNPIVNPMDTKDYPYEPVKQSISGAKVTTASSSYSYTGYARKPAPTVTLNGKKLISGSDYTFTYSNNTNAGTATITVTGIGSYKGTAKGTFKLTPVSLESASVKSNSESYTYTSYARCPKPTVILKNKTLTLNKDYTLSYSNNTNVGTATIIVKGKGNYNGTAKGTFKLTKASIAAASVKTKSASYVITGKPRCPQPIVKIGTRQLVLGKDYTLSYKNNVKVGTATVIVTGKGNYSGTAYGTFKLIK